MKTIAHRLVAGRPVRILLSLWWALKRNRECREQGMVPSGKTPTGAPRTGGLSLRRDAIGTAANQTQGCAADEETTTEARRIHGANEPVTPVAFAHAFLSQESALSAGHHLGLGLCSRDHRAGELWETLSYVVLWLCGLMGVGLCFL